VLQLKSFLLNYPTGEQYDNQKTLHDDCSYRADGAGNPGTGKRRMQAPLITITTTT